MKKITAILFLLLFAGSSSGASIELHYCMNKYAGWDFYTGTQKNCHTCGMHSSQKKKCCHDTRTHISTDKAIKDAIYSLSVSPGMACPVIPNISLVSPGAYLPVVQVIHKIETPPPLYNKRFIVFKALLI